jgi:arylformamidase
MSAARFSRLAYVLPPLLAAAAAHADPELLRTTYPLDDARGYCVDIAGFRATLRLDDPLQAHTCKYGTPLEDQLFEAAAGGKIRATGYDRCIAAAELEPGAALLVQACGSAPTQRWSLAAGLLRPESRTDLCVTVRREAGEPTGTAPLITPVYRRQDLALARCDAAAVARQTFRWSAADERGSGTANTVRTGMAADVAAKLAAFGREFDGPIATQTAQIYATQPHVYSADEIEVVKDLAYGPHERQHLDVHTAVLRRPDGPVPVIVAFHGGGLIGGNRAALTNVADYLASLGYVGVNSGYRLAPDATWPEGARDVGAAVTWLHEHAAEYGGDPEQIFVIGISTGALHAATYVFRADLMAAGTARPAGAILVSGPYTFDFATPSRGELAYFGEDSRRWPDMVVPGHVTATDVPVLFTTAEWDNPRYTGPFAKLFGELVLEHGMVPRYKQSPGHNHSSQLLSFGTADTSVSAEVVDFIERTIGH